MNPPYAIGTIVWVRLGQKWWPARVTPIEECPAQYTSDLKKQPLAVVRFFNESEFYDVAKADQIFPYNCTRKTDFIRKGLNLVKHDTELSEKFEADVAMAEKLTGGDMDITKSLKSTRKQRIDYSDLGFGIPKARKRSEDKCMQRAGFSDISEAIQYKRGSIPVQVKVVEHKTKILEQPKQKDMEEDMRSASNWFKCHLCGFTCSRLNVIIWHNKVHLKKVEDYDSGIRLPRRKKRKQKRPRTRDQKRAKMGQSEEGQANGHASPRHNSHDTSQQLLLDWNDEDEEEEGNEDEKADETVQEKGKGSEPKPLTQNGVDDDDDDDDDNDEEDEDEGETAWAGRGQRRPMPQQMDINSAFDALLAESSPLHNQGRGRAPPARTRAAKVNNDSDSDECSDWEEKSDEGQDESDSGSDSDAANPEETPNQNGFCEESASPSGWTSKTPSTKGGSRNAPPEEKSGGPSQKNGDPRRGSSFPEEEEPSSSSNSSSSSGPAYMLVAVDAHGNNVPMPVLSEAGNHLVAVEASMEDGTTRTLYIDPAHLGPNVDLNNLMLHIDNSGQETVIIPTSTSDGEIISSTLVDQTTAAAAAASQSHHHNLSSTSTASTNNNNSCKSKGDAAVEEETLQSNATTEENVQRGRDKDETRTKDVTSPLPAPGPPAAEAASRLSPPAGEKDRTGSGRAGGEGSKATPGEGKEERVSRNSEEGRQEEMEPEHTFDCQSPSEDDLPDLEINMSWRDLFVPDEIVWVLTHGLWWPSYILKIYKEEKKASILFINCQQKTPIKVNLARMKTFSCLNYCDIFEQQKDKAVGLTEAMETANMYRKLRITNSIKKTPRQFFQLPLPEQRSILNRQSLLQCEHSSRGGTPPLVSPLLGPVTDDEEDLARTPSKKEISEEVLSERERLKLVSAVKARHVTNEKYIRFMQSDACVEHLRSIRAERVDSDRHRYFKENHTNPHYLMNVTQLFNPGFDFFGVDQQTSEILSLLLAKFGQEMEPDLNSMQQKHYVNTVLFPEAIKEALRTVAKLSEEELEEALSNGVSQTRTEKKARRLDLELT